jgi:YHS domain-containing protein
MRLAACLVAALALAACASNKDSGTSGSMESPSVAAGHTMVKTKPSSNYPMTSCVVSGQPLSASLENRHAYLYDGQEVQFCCTGCISEFNKDPERYMQKVRAAR